MAGNTLRFVVVGTEHPHVFELVRGLDGIGAHEVGHHGAPGPMLDAYRARRTDSAPLTLTEALGAGADLVVLAGVPSERADHAVAALEAGASVLSDKPGVTSHRQLERVVAAEEAHPGRWWVLFSERFGNRAVTEAVRLTCAGAIGQVVDVVGLGPHTLAAAHRPAWFWSPDLSGGILADLATHQIDQFCALVDPDDTMAIQVVGSQVGNVANPQHPDMQDVGRLTLVGGAAVGTHRVDYLTAAGLASWGDCRLFVTGTEGSIEVRANVDPGGTPGGEHLVVVDDRGTRRVDVDGVTIDWPQRLAADLRTGSDTLMSSGHVQRVCRLALDAQAGATRWPAASG